MRTFVGMVLLSVGLSGNAVSLAQESGEEQQRAEAALQLTRDLASKYKFYPADGSEPCLFMPQPILRWSNPERGQIFGNVFLWTHAGRPFAVGSLYKWYSPFTHMSHEYHSLTTGGLRATYEGKEVWKISEKGVTFQELPEAPDVAATPAARLTQMRQLARRFTATATDANEKVTTLRLLSQPVYRYELTSDTEDGALFAFVEGTDPEVWLLLEARSNTGKPPLQWSYALARMNSVTMAVDYQGTEVWRVAPIAHKEFATHLKPYTKYHFDGPKP